MHIMGATATIYLPVNYDVQRRSERKALDVPVRIVRGDGSSASGRCVDASDEGFGIEVTGSLEVGELLKLQFGRSEAPPSFVARVVWQRGSRAGLYCVASSD